MSPFHHCTYPEDFLFFLIGQNWVSRTALTSRTSEKVIISVKGGQDDYNWLRQSGFIPLGSTHWHPKLDEGPLAQDRQQYLPGILPKATFLGGPVQC